MPGFRILTLIPARFRKAVYAVVAAATAVEAALDGVGWGVIPNDVQSKLLFVFGTLGLTMAASNTPKIKE